MTITPSYRNPVKSCKNPSVKRVSPRNKRHIKVVGRTDLNRDIQAEYLKERYEEKLMRRKRKEEYDERDAEIKKAEEEENEWEKINKEWGKMKDQNAEELNKIHKIIETLLGNQDFCWKENDF